MRPSLAGALLVLLLPLAAAAQVGYPPSESPFREIRKGHSLTLTAGYFGGGGGSVEVGPRNGPTFGARYDIRVASPLQLGLGLAYGELERYLTDPFVRLSERYTGPVKQSTILADVTVQLNLTGGKSWRGIAPFLAIAGGLANGSSLDADTSGYKFGTKFYFAPSIGTRVFLSERIHLRAEFKPVFWKLSYPDSFRAEPPAEPGNPPESSNAVTARDSEWTGNPWLQVGLSYTFFR